MGKWDKLDAEEDAALQRRTEELILATSVVEEKFDRGGIFAKLFPGQYQAEADALDAAQAQLQEDQREVTRRRQVRQQEEQAEEDRRAAKERARKEAQEKEQAALLRDYEIRQKFAEERAEFYKQQALQAVPAASPPSVRHEVPADPPASTSPRGDQMQDDLKPRQGLIKVGRAGAAESMRPAETKGAASATSSRPSAPTPATSSRPPIAAGVQSQTVREPVVASAASTTASMTGEQLVAWRKGRGMTQGALAALLDTTQGNISKAESKLNAPISADWVKRLSRS